MWIYQKNEKGSALINVDHVSRFYVNKSAVYATIGDCDIERVIGLQDEEEARKFMAWLATKIHYNPDKNRVLNIADYFNRMAPDD